MGTRTPILFLRSSKRSTKPRHTQYETSLLTYDGVAHGRRACSDDRVPGGGGRGAMHGGVRVLGSARARRFMPQRRCASRRAASPRRPPVRCDAPVRIGSDLPRARPRAHRSHHDARMTSTDRIRSRGLRHHRLADRGIVPPARAARTAPRSPALPRSRSLSTDDGKNDVVRRWWR